MFCDRCRCCSNLAWFTLSRRKMYPSCPAVGYLTIRRSVDGTRTYPYAVDSSIAQNTLATTQNPHLGGLQGRTIVCYVATYCDSVNITVLSYLQHATHRRRAIIPRATRTLSQPYKTQDVQAALFTTFLQLTPHHWEVRDTYSAQPSTAFARGIVDITIPARYVQTCFS
ncbi:hypothetical protein BC835DRAFT_570172 [Cytidiella melzeri]|nr:hypothetical protein BC835DRAFT_570172 [Cytidiella melzeri]